MADFGAMPFDFDAEGNLVFGEVKEVASEVGAKCLAAAMAATSPGAVAFSKGESEPPVILARYGVGAEDTPVKEAA
jgi:hypothetical protein